jgi:hypothetical protein
MALAANWHKLAEIVGVVKPPSLSLVPIRIDMGTLQSAQNFYFDNSTTLTINVNSNVSKLIIAIPSSASEWYSMAGGFKELYLKVSIDITTLTLPNIPLVANGVSAINPGSDSAYWKFEFQETPLTYYSFKGEIFVLNPLEPGNHTVRVEGMGETSIPAQQVNFDITIYLEIIPS